MKCSLCKINDAIIHIHEYSGRGIIKINLCIECALQKGLSDDVKSIDGIFVNLIKNIFKIIDPRRRSKRSANQISLVCPTCNTEITDITEELEVGCLTCYSVFEKIIDLVIFRQNNSLTYRGKLPKDLVILRKNKSLLRKLKSELKERIDAEDYFKAATIRDEIKELKKKIQKGFRKIANK